MRVVYLHQYFNTPDMAGATRSYEFARRLVASGHEVHMITSDRSEYRASSASRWRTETISGISVHWVSVPYSNKLSFTKRIRAFLLFAIHSARRASSLDGDIVFATSTPLTIAIPAVYASRKSRIPMVFEVRDLWPAVPIALGILRNPIIKWAARRLEQFAYRHSERIVALAPGMKREISGSGYPEHRISVIPNGCDIELFAKSEASSRELRTSNEWLGNRPLVVYVGAIGRINAVDYLVELATRTLDMNPEIRFAVVGTGHEEENVRELARIRGVLGRNFFMIGQLPKRLAAGWICAADITVALVRGPRFIWKDATQNKYFDSLAAAKPVLSNYDGWQAQVATDAGAGLILDAEDYEAASAELVRRLDDTAWLAKASSAARMLATTEFARDKHGRELEQLLLETLADYGRASPAAR